MGRQAIRMFGPVDDRVREQMERCQQAEPDAPAVLCADNHLGYSMPIGGVIGYEGLISPSAVGYDIGCGNMAVRTNVLAAQIDVPTVMADIGRLISFGMGRNNDERVEHPIIDALARSPVKVQRAHVQLARNQLGTVGSGNHYVDLFEDVADGVLWVGVHFGSRGIGHKTATWALEAAGRGRNDSMDAPPVVIPVQTPLGQDYIQAMQLAGEYAHAGREWVIGRVLGIIGASAVDTVHNHHNFAWRETHGGRTLWVHRKGATPAFPGQRGFVGGTMGECAVILHGSESPSSERALFSTVHGAGRAMSRTQAAGRVRRSKSWACMNHRNRTFSAPARGFDRSKERSLPLCPTCGSRMQRTTEQVQEGAVDWPAAKARLKKAGIVLIGAGADEAPEAYKRLDDVLGYHGDTIVIEHRLRPVGVAMAGPDIEDLYRD